MDLYNRQSSAKRRTDMCGSMTLGRSFMKHKNSKGPRTVPWGTPESTLWALEWQPSIITLCVLADRKDLIQVRSSPCMPSSSNFRRRRRWGTVSNALLKSNTATSTCSLRSILVRRSWVVSKSWDSHECLLRNPWLKLVRIPCLSMCARICEHMICSSILQVIHVKDTGR